MRNNKLKPQIDLMIKSSDYFAEIVDEACLKTKVKTFPLAKNYLVGLLNHFMFSQNLFLKEETNTSGTMAELFLNASNSTKNKKHELFKKLGDSSLYMADFLLIHYAKKLLM